MNDDRTVIVKTLEKSQRENLRIAQTTWTPLDHPDRTFRFIDLRVFMADGDKPTQKGVRFVAGMTQAVINALTEALDWSAFEFAGRKQEPAPEGKDPLAEAHHDKGRDDVPF